MIGTHKQQVTWGVEGLIDRNRLTSFAHQFISEAGMTPARPGRIDDYPFNGGGGNGYTGYFPLMESFLIFDCYTDQNRTEILLSTCKPDRLQHNLLGDMISDAIGPVVSYHLYDLPTQKIGES